jgi:hypothetical protein
MSRYPQPTAVGRHRNRGRAQRIGSAYRARHTSGPTAPARSNWLAGWRRLRDGIAVCVSVIITLSLAGCGSSAPPSRATTAPAASVSAVRWWSDPAASAGSPIDPTDPTGAAAQLNRSRPVYCTMLRQTAAAGHSVLPSFPAGDPALLASTEAFVAEIGAVAPDAVAAQWQTLGGGLVALVKSGGKISTLKASDVAGLTPAANAIAADAKLNCGLNLSIGKS